MSADTIFMFAILVYVLMAGGVFLTIREFNRMTEDPSIRKSVRLDSEANETENG
jgi:hypothetical protein